MTKIVGIRFRTAGKIYYFDPADFDLDMAMHVIVETARGIEMGTVLIPPKEVDDDKVVSPLKPVIRVATDEDEKTVERNKEKEKEAFAICKEKIIKHGLEMKLVDAEYTFDGNKLLFYFTADGRIDFRELVKDLAAVFRTRIELRQIGVRDETKMMGGIEYAADRSAVILIWRILCRFPSRWQRSRISRSIQPRYPVCAEGLCAVSSMSRIHMSI